MKLYVKAPVKIIKPVAPKQEMPAWPGLKWLPLVLVSIGTFLVVFVTAPILTYELVSAPDLKSTGWVSPLAENLVAEVGSQVKGTATLVAAQEQTEPDYTQVSNWFPTAPQQEARQSKITHYTVDIPELRIKNAVVTIGGENLKEGLIQYGGTANPGELGAPVIFGHSILRQFYNPSETNPQRYMSIFSTIMTLETGDEIYVNYDGIKYKYVVRKKYQVEPEDIDILAQRYDQKLLRLITCVPEGTYLHRGVVEAALQPI